MKKNSRFPFRWVFAGYYALLALSFLLMLACVTPVNADSDFPAFDRTGTYAGVFAGFGRTNNRIVDVDGFANWGNPGSLLDYEETGYVGGALMGKKFDFGGVLLRIEVDGTFGVMSAKSNKLDPIGLDETVETKIPWIVTSRVGIEQAMGGTTVFATSGLAVARIINSVTDIDFAPGMPTRKDDDDSFRDSSMKIGWVLGIGIEVPLADTWALRLGGSHLDFGRSAHHVNKSGNNRCGRGGPLIPCPYKLRNKLGMIRISIIRRF